MLAFNEPITIHLIKSRMTVKKVYQERQEVSILTPLKMMRYLNFIFTCFLHQLLFSVYADMGKNKMID